MKTRNKVLSIFVMATMLMSIVPFAHASISIQNVTPIQGNPGTRVLGGSILATNVTLSGEAHPGDQVQVNWDGGLLPAESQCGQCITTASSSSSSQPGFYTIWFLVPQTPSGAHTISVSDITNPSEGSVTSQFTVTPVMELSPNLGFVSGPVSVFATGLPSNAALPLTYAESPVGQVNTNRFGSATSSFTVPDSILGGHNVRITDQSQVPLVTRVFTVRPNIVIQPSQPKVGSTLTVRATGFGNLDTVTVYFSQDLKLSNILATLGNFTADDKGAFPFSFTIPATSQFGQPPASTFYLVGVDRTQQASGNSPFQLNPSLSLTPDHGAVNQQIEAAAAGFAANSNVVVTIDGLSRNLHTGVTDATGSFSFAFVITSSDGLSFGTHHVTATDAKSFTASTTFIFGTQIVLTPNKGIAKSPTDKLIPGTTVSVQGFVFTPRSTVTIQYDTTTMTTVAANSNGDFTTSFVVPESVGGAHQVVATDDAANSRTAQTVFTVVPWLQIDASKGTVPSTQTVSGTGFDASASVNVYYCGLSPSTTSLLGPTTQCATVSVFSLDSNNAPTTSSAWTISTTGLSNGLLGSNILVDQQGGFSTSLTIPDSYGGYHPLWASEVAPGTAMSINGQIFRVEPSVTLNPTSSQRDRQVTVTAHGELQSEQYKIDNTVHSFQYGLVLDFGPNTAYMDQTNHILNGQFDQSWASGGYLPFAITQSGNVVRVFNPSSESPTLGTSQFLRVPSIEPADYQVNVKVTDVSTGQPISDSSATVTVTFTVISPEITAINSHTDSTVNTAVGTINGHTDTVSSNIQKKIDDVTGQLTKSIGDARDAVLSLVGTKATDTVNQINAHIDTQLSGAVSSINGHVDQAVTSINGHVDQKVGEVTTSINTATTSIVSQVNSHTDTQVSGAVTTINGHVDASTKALNDTITSTTTSVKTAVSSTTASLTTAINSRASQATVDSLQSSVNNISGTATTTQSKVADLQNGVSLTVQTPVGYVIAILAALAAIGSIAAAVITSRRLKVAA